MPIKKLLLKMNKKTELLLANYLSSIKHKRVLLTENIRGCEQFLFDEEMRLFEYEKNYKSRIGNSNNVNIGTVIDNKVIKKIQERIEEKKSMLQRYYAIDQLYDDIDAALVGIAPDSYKAIELYYMKKFTMKQLMLEFGYSIQYVHNLIHAGLNEIYDSLNEPDLNKAVSFLKKGRM